MKLKRNIIIITFFTFIIVFICKEFYKDYTLSCKYYCNSFYGEIRDLNYSKQKHIKVLVGERWIPLSLFINYGIKIEVGDSISKETNSFITNLTKKGKTFDISSEQEYTLLKKNCKCN